MHTYHYPQVVAEGWDVSYIHCGPDCAKCMPQSIPFFAPMFRLGRMFDAYYCAVAEVIAQTAGILGMKSGIIILSEAG